MERPNPLNALSLSDRFAPYTALWNVTGQPAISLPLFHSDDGLPVGVQLVGPPADDTIWLTLAGQLEQTVPWRRKFSPLALGTQE
jgi:amidase